MSVPSSRLTPSLGNRGLEIHLHARERESESGPSHDTNFGRSALVRATIQSLFTLYVYQRRAGTRQPSAPHQWCRQKCVYKEYECCTRRRLLSKLFARSDGSPSCQVKPLSYEKVLIRIRAVDLVLDGE